MKFNRTSMLALISIITVSYLGAGFALRNKSPLWCHLSLGAFDQTGVQDIDTSSLEAPAMTPTTKGQKVYGCERGIFGFLD